MLGWVLALTAAVPALGSPGLFFPPAPEPPPLAVHVLLRDLEPGSQARIFCIVCFPGCAQSLIVALLRLFSGRDGSVLCVLIFLAMLLFCFCLSYFGLHVGAKKVVAVIRKALFSE